KLVTSDIAWIISHNEVLFFYIFYWKFKRLSKTSNSFLMLGQWPYFSGTLKGVFRHLEIGEG
ncbi:hypothetical protein ACW9VY_12815, partial [Lactiplantibacillus plantarum]